MSAAAAVQVGLWVVLGSLTIALVRAVYQAFADAEGSERFGWAVAAAFVAFECWTIWQVLP